MRTQFYKNLFEPSRWFGISSDDVKTSVYVLLIGNSFFSKYSIVGILGALSFLGIKVYILNILPSGHINHWMKKSSYLEWNNTSQANLKRSE